MTSANISTTRLIGNLRAPQIAHALNNTAIIVQPLGAVEQHGPHLPLNTDLVIADAVASAAVAKIGEDLNVWLLPPLAFTKSNEHAWSPGTIWLTADTLLRVLDDIGRCIAKTGVERLVFLNGHGGNSSLVSVANRELRLKYGLKTFLAHPGLPADQGGLSPVNELGMGVHAGTDETSMMLYLRPDLVDMSLAVRRIPEKLAANKHVKFGGSVSFGWMSNDFNDEGFVGDPTIATAELGKTLFEGAVDNFCSALKEIASFNFGK